MARQVAAALRIAAALLVFAAGPVLADDASSSLAAPAAGDNSTVPDEFQNMVGDWSLAQQDDSLPKCPLTFTDQPSAGGWTVVIPDSCPAPYPAADQLAAWTIDPADNSVELLDAKGNVTLKLFEDEDGLYDTDPSTDPRFYLLAPYEQNGNGGEDDDAD
jgi:hypothetical protein